MRQFGLDTVYAGVTLNQDDVELGRIIDVEREASFVVDVASVELPAISSPIFQGYGHDKAFVAYLDQAFDTMIEAVADRGSIDIEDETLYCCACSACSGEQEPGLVIIDGYATVYSMLESEMDFGGQSQTFLQVLTSQFDLTAEQLSSMLYNAETGNLIVIEGFDGLVGKGASLTLNDDGSGGVLEAGTLSTTVTVAAAGDIYVDGVINGDRWANPDGSIDYSFSLTGTPYQYAGTGNEALPANFNTISAQQEAAAHFALSAIEGNAAAAGFSVEGFTNLDINFLGNVDDTQAEIRFGETSDPGTGTARVADFPGGQVTASPNDDGDVWFGVAFNFRVPEAGTYSWITMIHEIGHALGLKHSHQNYNFGTLPADLDAMEYSVMSYRSFIGGSTTGGYTNEQFGFAQTFMIADIATLQYMYGADFTANDGDTVYTWTPGSGDTVIDGVVAINPGGNRIFATIWDGDGNDTYDLSAYATDLEIDLRPGEDSLFSAAQQAALGGGNVARANIYNAILYQGDTRSLIENAIGGSGDDLFVGNQADNVIDGGAGEDTVDYSEITDDLTVSLDGMGSASSVQAGSDSLIGIENFLSGSGNDTIDGSADVNLIKGGDGNDTIDGLGGDDVLWGEIGNDIIIGGAGNDVLLGGNDLGTDGLGFGSGAITRGFNSGFTSIANALNIDDEFSIATDSDIINSTTLPHVTITASGDDAVHFYEITVVSDGTDIILDIDYGDTGGAGSFDSQLDLYDSSGTLIASNAFAPFVAGAGGSTSNNDAYIATTLATAGLYYIAVSTNGGTDVVLGASYELQVSLEDTAIIDPDTGDDTLTGGMGDDILDGGAGTDYASYSGVQANYTVTDNMDGSYLVVDNVGTDGSDTLTNIEFLIFTDVTIDITTAPGGGGPVFTEGNDNEVGTAGDDVLDGLGGNDIIDGLAGNDTINGGDGADRLIGGEGADALHGDAGFDSADYRGALAGVAFNVDTGGTGGEANGDTFSGIERYYLSNFNDTVTGSSANEFFYGEDGNDTINAGGGIDRLYGGDGNDIQRGQDGNDQLYGSAGNDQLNGGAGFDIANYSLATAAVTVNMLTGGTGGDAAGDTYFGIEAVYGSDFADIITGNNSSNELRGGDGSDVINGGGGNDRIFGGEGVDSIDGGTGIDIINFTTATSAVGVILGGLGFLGEANGDSYTSIEWVFGSDFNDQITGDAANNRLEGRDGNDTLNGEGGNDRLLGGDGNDTINGGDGVDTIFGQDGDDVMTGGAGNDFFFGGVGADMHDGGDGIDTVSYLTSTIGLTIIMDPGSGTATGDAAGDDYSSIERVFGSGFDDYIVGTVFDDVLVGNGGDDYLFGNYGNDTLIGGAGVDSYGYGPELDGADVIFGFTTNELIYIFDSGGLYDSFAEIMAAGTDVGSNVVFNFGTPGESLTLVGVSLADLDASNFDFSGTPPPAAEPLSDPDAFAAEAFEDMVAMFDMDALI